MWIGGNGCLARLRNGVISTITAKNGLPDDDVFSIVEDKHGRLWMGCNIGIISVSKVQLNECADGKRQSLDYTLYDRTNGMRTSNPTVPGTGCILPDGRLAFPTIKGVVIIDPNNIPKDMIPPKVQVQELIADTLHFISLRQTLQASAEQVLRGEVLTIPAGKTNIEIRYTALNFYAPEKVRFKYRLEGVDDAWIDAGTRREVFYTNLAPREYSFRVLACNSDGVWNELGAELRFRIEPFWYQTLWFKVLCVLLACVGLFLLYRYRTWRLRARAQILEETVQERTHELQESNAKTQRANIRLQEQKEQLVQANIELTAANDEILRQQHILEVQAADIELANSQLNENNLKLQNLNHEKNEFLGIAAHDLKNPLTAMQMTASLVLKYQDKMSREDLRERLESVIVSTTRMSEIITNLLDINAIESGKMNLHPIDFDIVPLVRQTVLDYSDRAMAKDITLLCENVQTSLHVYADASASLQILDNLISNAVKYSPPGKNVFVRVRHSSLAIGHLSDENRLHRSDQVTNLLTTNGYVCVEIQDEGPGLSDEDKTKLFGKFARLSARPTAGEHSTGLGLSIVKRLAEAMNGNIHCESTLGEGATFILVLPQSSQS
jgi:signal transduction histidine kinase